MRSLLPVVVFFWVAPMPAQSPLSLPFTANNGLSAGACVFFDLNVTEPNGITIHTLDVNTGASAVGTLGTVEFYRTPTTYVGSEQVAANWTLAASGPVMAMGNNVPSPCCLGAGSFLPQGSHGIAVRHVGVALRYTGTSATVPPVPNSVTTTEATLTAGASQATLFTSAPFAFRVFNGNIYYNVGNVPGGSCTPFATKALYGVGCYRNADSWYENFADLTNFDLVGAPAAEQVIVASPLVPLGHSVAAGASAWFPPASAPMLSNATTPGPMTDDTMSGPRTLPFPFNFPGGSTTTIHVCVNGFIVLGATTAITGDFTPTVAEMLGQLPRLFALWGDWQAATNLTTNPASGVYYDVDPSNQAVYVTWLDVADRRGGVPVAGATTVNVQCALRANGSVEFRYRNVIPRVGGVGAVMVGSSKGNLVAATVSVDPGNRDLTAAMPFATNGPDRLPLALDSNNPRLGLNWTLTTTNFTLVSPVGITFFGDTQVNPGLDLTFLGAPGCRGFTNANVFAAVFPVAAAAGNLVIPVPGSSALAGIVLSAQSAGFTLDNVLNLHFSNGLLGTLGQ